MGENDDVKIIIAKCYNCNHEQIALLKDKKIKMVCERCGAENVSKIMSRRHLQVDMYAPKGQELMIISEI